jgi:phosphotransferase system  glucose/maltose/N-acetylglucosamine-specific IIC component
MSSAPQPGDKSAGFSGLILGGIAPFVIMFGIVRMTNAKYAGHEAAPAAGATTTGH